MHRLYIRRGAVWQFWVAGPPGFVERERDYLENMLGAECRVDIA
jgi:hypothetical protein